MRPFQLGQLSADATFRDGTLHAARPLRDLRQSSWGGPIIAAEEGADPARASFLALWHDSQETRTGDLPHTVAGYLIKPDPRQITADQTEKLPDRSRELIRSAVDEYESRETAEARCAKDADSLEMLLQAAEYRDIGVHRVDGWIDSARKSLKTETGQRIADAAVSLSPLAWRDR